MLRLCLLAITKALLSRILADAEHELEEAGMVVEIIRKDRLPVCKARSRKKR